MTIMINITIMTKMRKIIKIIIDNNLKKNKFVGHVIDD